MRLDRVPARAAGGFHVVVETPRGAPCKLTLDPELGVLALERPLRLAFAWPYDFGFVPSTRAPSTPAARISCAATSRGAWRCPSPCANRRWCVTSATWSSPRTSPTRRARRMRPDGSYARLRPRPEGGADAQLALLHAAAVTGDESAPGELPKAAIRRRVSPRRTR